MLAKAGHKVRVLERQSRVGTPAAGLRVPPNLSKILKRWIGEEELRKNAVVNLETPWYDCECHRPYHLNRRSDDSYVALAPAS